MYYGLCALTLGQASLITLHSLQGHGGLQASSFACELVLVVTADGGTLVF